MFGLTLFKSTKTKKIAQKKKHHTIKTSKNTKSNKKGNYSSFSKNTTTKNTYKRARPTKK